jgi:hypothetical protein
MKKTLLFFLLMVSLGSNYAQSSSSQSISFDGFYIAKTGRVEAASLDIYTYLHFYNDSTVYLQTVTSNSPQEVARWFGRNKSFSQSGTYQLKGNTISIQLNNKKSEDIKLEGLQQTVFSGKITSDNQLCMVRDKEVKEKCFAFTKITDAQ